MEIKILASGSDGNAYIISDGNSDILLECGLSLKRLQKLASYNIPLNCLVSHCHLDHAKAAKDLIDQGYNVYLAAETAESLNLSGYFVHIVNAGQQFTIESFIIVPFDLYHCNSDGSSCKNLGYLIYSTVIKEKILFATDTAYIKNQFKSLNYIMIEVNYDDDIMNSVSVDEVEKRRYKSHMSLETAINFIKSTDLSNVECIYAIHLSKDRCDKDLILKELQGVSGIPIIIC